MRLDPEILDRAPDEGARVVSLALCAAAEEAAGRLRSSLTIARQRMLRRIDSIL